MGLNDDGFVTYPWSSDVMDWASAALPLARRALRGAERRHGGTWAPGVDLLANEPDGAVAGVPLLGPWRRDAQWSGGWHRAQISAVWPGYPRQDARESDAAHRYRKVRDAAHVDGLLPVGPDRRRFPREFHAFVLGIPLTTTSEAPTVVWRGSHHIVRHYLSEVIADRDASSVDVTEAYHAARRAVFESCERVEMSADEGACYLIHRLALHGTAPWSGPAGEPRIVAFFRPELDGAGGWLATDQTTAS